MVEGPGCKIKGEKLKARTVGQSIQTVGGNAVEEKVKKTVTSRADNVTAQFQTFIGRTIEDVQTLGKELFIFFKDVQVCLRCHFLMNGGFRLNGSDIDGGGGGNTDTVTLMLRLDKDTLDFHECAVSILLSKDCLEKIHTLQELDICAVNFSHGKALAKFTANTNRLVCDVLLDQEILPGVGNIIKNEALFDSGIHPNTEVKNLTDAQLKLLIKLTRDFSMIFYNCRKYGKPLEPHLKVYRKSKCGQCSGKIITTRVGEDSDRLTSYCPNCQSNRTLPHKNSLLAWVHLHADMQQEWACSQCTLINPAVKAHCSVCGSDRVPKLVTAATDHHGLVNIGSAHNRKRKLEDFRPAGVTKKMKVSDQDNLNANVSKASLDTRKKTPLCHVHKVECVVKQVHKKGPNCNRIFWACPKSRTKCNFFQWADDNFPLCDLHGKRCILRTVLKEGPNNGREFFVCSLPKQTQCQFFQWADKHLH